VANTYYIHIGYDYNSYKLGSVWGNENPNETSFYWLQYALTSGSSATSPWTGTLFQFNENDQVYFQIWDLTDWGPTVPQLSQVCVNLFYIAVNQLSGEFFSSTSVPVSVSASNRTLAWSSTDPSSIIEAQDLSLTVPSPNPILSPWGDSSFITSSTIGPLTITGSSSMSFKLSFKLSFTYTATGKPPGTPRIFIADPETTIGSGRTF
jgi:hypothetical protein